MLSLRELCELAERHRDAWEHPVRAFELAGQQVGGGQPPAVMGVINLSPDSWYRESVCLSTEAAVRRGRVLQAQGALVVDVGAESTLAHAERVDAALQQGRLLPVVRELSDAGVAVSVETYHPEVARAALEAGARVLNLTGTAAMEPCLEAAAAHGAAVILCHVQGPNVREVGDFEHAGDVVGAMYEHFAPRVEEAVRLGVERLFIDPGLGFYYRNLQDSAERVRFQMRVFLETFRLRRLGFPICHALPHAFEFFGEEVRCAEPFFAVLAALGGASLFRTHEVPRTLAVLRTLGCW